MPMSIEVDVNESTQSLPTVPLPVPGATPSQVLAVGAAFGPFRVEAHLGAGGMGTVYRASDSRLSRSVALKVLLSNASDVDARERLRREGVALASLQHPGIATVYQAGEIDGVAYIAMELVTGTTLREVLAAARLESAEALRIADEIAAAIEHAHSERIIHRDLKPANVMLTDGRAVKVLDFGLAKMIGTPGLTATGNLMGTPNYMSPEQTQAADPAEPSDIWAWACVTFELLTGEKAFPGNSVGAAFAAILRDTPAWQALPLDVSIGFRTLLQDCLRRDAGERPPDMKVVRRRLVDAFKAPSVPADPPRTGNARADRFHALVHTIRETDTIDSAAVAVLAVYVQALTEAVRDLLKHGVLSTSSAVSVRREKGGVFAASPGYRAPIQAGGALTLELSTPQNDPRVYAAANGHLQVEIPTAVEKPILIRWLPTTENPVPAETLVAIPFVEAVPELTPRGRELIDPDCVMDKLMDLLMERARFAVQRAGYALPDGLVPQAAPVLFPRVRNATARELLVAIIAGMQPRDDYHGFWGSSTLAGWSINLSARRKRDAPERELSEWSGRFEVSDVETLVRLGYVHLERHSTKEFRGTVADRAFDEYDAAAKQPQ